AVGVRAASSALAEELEALAAIVRRSTVQVRTGDVGVGSGIIWRDDGLVLTNAHVARGQRATVRLWDGELIDARVIRRDPRRDLDDRDRCVSARSSGESCECGRCTRRVTRVLVVAASPVVRAGLEALLAQSPALVIVGIVARASTVGEEIEGREPDVVLMDVD